MNGPGLKTLIVGSICTTLEHTIKSLIKNVILTHQRPILLF